MKCIWLALIFAVVEISLAKKNQFARQVDNIKSNNIPLNNRPIIGILSQEVSPSLAIVSPAGSLSYIAASYVKFVEGQGGRVVPIRINQTDSYYETIFNSINGLIIPGGGASLETSDYARIGSLLYELAIKSNSNGDFFPILGICLGFELMLYLSAGTNLLTNCDSYNQALKLDFLPEAYNSRIYKNARNKILKMLSEEALTANFHHWCMTNESFSSSAFLKDMYTPLATSTNPDNITFIANFEAKKYPFWGVQFHPEKNIYEWNYSSIPHNSRAVELEKVLIALPR